MITARYLVADVDAAIAFYTTHLGFALERQFGPAMAIVVRDGFNLWLAGPASSAARAMPDGRKPEAGGWNRIVIQVEDLEALVGRLRSAGAVFRNDVLTGVGGKQILVEDPSGNAIELFESA